MNVTNFLVDNTPNVFGFKFEDISLFELIVFPESKAHLIAAQKSLDKGIFDGMVEEATTAFHKLIYSYKESKSNWVGRQGFEFISPIHNRQTLNSQAISKINENLISLNTALEIISLGIDYRKYTKFQFLRPLATRMGDGTYVLELFGKRNWSKENCQFLIDFVVECALKLQEFDFSVDSLDDTDTTFEMEII